MGKGTEQERQPDGTHAIPSRSAQDEDLRRIPSRPRDATSTLAKARASPLWLNDHCHPGGPRSGRPSGRDPVAANPGIRTGAHNLGPATASAGGLRSQPGSVSRWSGSGEGPGRANRTEAAAEQHPEKESGPPERAAAKKNLHRNAVQVRLYEPASQRGGREAGLWEPMGYSKTPTRMYTQPASRSLRRIVIGSTSVDP